MSSPALPEAFRPHAEQGEAPVEIRFADEIFVKQTLVPKAGTFLPQHSHAYEHLSMIAVGAVRLWLEGELVGEYTAPTGIPIAAGKKHLFETLADDTLIYCIHNISRTGSEEILEEHIVATEG